MDTTPLCAFANKVTRSNRIVFGDLRRLQRDVLPTGPSCREDIETLLSLDSLGQLDDEWPGYLVTAVRDFVLTSSDPPGSVDADSAAWLATALADARPRTAAAVVRAILVKAHQADEALLAFGRRGAQRSTVPEAEIGPAPPGRRGRKKLTFEVMV